MSAIMLIAGHGAGDPGATAKINGVLYKEYLETRSVASEVRARLLSKYVVDVGQYNPDKNAYEDCRAKRLSAKIFEDYDFVLEIHFNAYRGESADGQTKGVECYVPVAAGDADKKIASVLCAEVAKLGLRDRGVKTKDYAVIKYIRGCGVKCALLEVCFLDDPDDMKVYLNNKSAVADAIVKALASALGLREKPKTDYEIVQEKAGLEDKTMRYLSSYRYGTELIRKLARAMRG